MKNKFILICGLMLISLTAFCRFNQEEVKRTITKNFKVSANSMLQIDNKYGNITILEWSKNEINFLIEITGRANNKDDAQKMSDRVTVDFNQLGDKLTAATNFSKANMSCNNCGTTINYTVNVPKSVYLELYNKYGNVSVDETVQKFKADIKYGNLTANRLMGKGNDIQIKYGNVNVTETTDLSLNIGYSNAVVSKADKLNLTSAYSKLNSKSIGEMRLTSKYDKFNIEVLESIDLTSAYSDFTIGDLQKSFVASSLRYCKLSIKEVGGNFDKIIIDANYTNIILGVNENHNFNADLHTRYGSVNTGNLTFNNVKIDESDKYVKGISGIAGSSNNPKAIIKISNTYADITLR